MANMEARPYVAMLGNSTLPELHRFATEGADWGFDTKLLNSALRRSGFDPADDFVAADFR